MWIMWTVTKHHFISRTQVRLQSSEFELENVSISMCQQSYGRTIDTSTVYTIMDKNQQTVPLARLDKIKDIGVYFDVKLDFKDHNARKNKQSI